MRFRFITWALVRRLNRIAHRYFAKAQSILTAIEFSARQRQARSKSFSSGAGFGSVLAVHERGRVGLQHSQKLKGEDSIKTLKFFVCLSLIMLVSCVHQLTSTQSREAVTHCKEVCQQHLALCQKTCRNNCVQCHAYAASKSLKAYRNYAHEQCVRGAMRIRQLNSYHDPLQCAKTTCNCSADYQVCRQSCSGFIHKQLLAPPLSR